MQTYKPNRGGRPAVIVSRWTYDVNNGWETTHTPDFGAARNEARAVADASGWPVLITAYNRDTRETREVCWVEPTETVERGAASKTVRNEPVSALLKSWSDARIAGEAERGN